MSKHRFARFVAIALLILAFLVLVGGIFGSLVVGNRGFGSGWSEGWIGWFTIPVIAFSCSGAFWLLMLGAILLLLVDISNNMAKVKLAAAAPAGVVAAPAVAAIAAPPVAAAAAVAAVEITDVAAEAPVEAPAPKPKQTRTRAAKPAAAAVVAIAAVEAAKPDEEPAAAVVAPSDADLAALPASVAALEAGEPRLPGTDDAARVAAELAAIKAVEVEADKPKRERKPAKFSTRLVNVAGIGESTAEKLSEIGIRTTEDLLLRGATRKGRQEIADQTGLSAREILTWVNHVDLFRVRGVGEEYALLLEAAGVDTVVELGQRNPANLQVKLIAINDEKHLVRQAPVVTQVERWVEDAKTLPRIVKY